ncbi:MAG: hypothetical protein WC443_11860, partial [Desulfobaccales bacterium]
MIKKLILMVGVVGLLAVLIAPQNYAQQQQVPSEAPVAPAPPVAPVAPAAPQKVARHYNPQAVETLVGTVAAVNRVSPK